MTFKADKNLVKLVFFLLLSAIYFSITHFLIKGNQLKYIILFVLLTFIIFNLISLLKRRVDIDDEKISVTALLGKKDIAFRDITDAVFLYLRGRVILILADEEKFVFVSSVIQDFDKIINEIKNRVDDEIKEKLSFFNEKKYNKSKELLYLFLTVSSLFLIGFATYNLLFI